MPDSPRIRPYPSTAKRPNASGVMSGYGARVLGSIRRTGALQVSVGCDRIGTNEGIERFVDRTRWDVPFGMGLRFVAGPTEELGSER